MKEFKTTENLEEKIKVTSLEIIVTGSKEKPYFEIKYKELGKEDYSIGYSSYDLNNVFAWKDECFEIVTELAEEYKGGWIACSERLPERNKNVLCWAKSTARGGDACFVGSCDNGFWFLQTAVDTLSYPTQYEVVAWCELPAPYTEGE